MEREALGAGMELDAAGPGVERPASAIPMEFAGG
jgi:hypothetical protein